jgi:MSHA biogenesis protein MshM
MPVAYQKSLVMKLKNQDIKVQKGSLMYEDYFRLTSLPFKLTPTTNFYCQLNGHEAALNTLLYCIRSGEGFVKIIGEVGAGKTLLCRKLLEQLQADMVCAYLPNPDLNPMELKTALARELGLNPREWSDPHELITGIQQHLIALHSQGKKVVVVIDEAQALSDQSLESIRLLTNLETADIKLLQVVLFAQPELDARLNLPHLRQLKQRITFSYQLPLLNRHEVETYLHHRLAISGYTHGDLFTKKARHLLYQASGGIPRLINILCHKSLIVAYCKGKAKIDQRILRYVIHDTDAAIAPAPPKWKMWVVSIPLLLLMSYCLYTYRNLLP